MANRIKEIKDNYIAVDRAFERLYCGSHGHTEDCPFYGHPEAYEYTVCKCGYDRNIEDLRNALKVLGDSIK